MAIDIGLIAFNAYQQALPPDPSRSTWQQLGKTECDAWRNAAVAVCQYLNKCRQEMDDGVIE